MFNTTVYDNGLSQLLLTETLYICSGDPTTFQQATSTLKLGTKASPSLSGPTDRQNGGREVTVAAVTNGTIDATGTATHWALVDNSASALLATGSLSSPQAVTTGNPFTLGAFTVGFQPPA